MTTLTYEKGSIRFAEYESGHQHISVHASSRHAEMRARCWPVTNERAETYISATVDTDGCEITTYLSIAQAVAMRDALTVALGEASSDE